jgi:hypothetical protein
VTTGTRDGLMSFTGRLPALCLPLVILRERALLAIGYLLRLGLTFVELISELRDSLKDTLKPCKETRIIRSQQVAIFSDEGLQPQMENLGFLRRVMGSYKLHRKMSAT